MNWQSERVANIVWHVVLGGVALVGILFTALNVWAMIDGVPK